MASIVLTNTARFSPYSFNEMLKPLAMATQEQRAIEEGISELGTKADLMRMYANEEPDSKVATMYNKYASDLDKQAESLAKQGLSPSSRSSLLGLKRRYSSEITPIETAVTRRRQLAEEQRKARAQDDSILFDIDARTISLDDLVNNPELSYSSVSGKNIMENVSKAASVLAKEARNDPNKFNSRLGGDYYEYVKQYGFSKEAVMDAILRSKNASNVLTSIVDSAMKSSGVKDNWSGDAYNRALDYANRGLWSAVGQTQTQLVDNWRAKLEAQRKGSGNPPTTGGFALNPSNIYSSKEQEKVKSIIERYSKYFTKNSKGETVITPEGIKEYRRNNNERITTAGSGSGTARLINAEVDKKPGYSPTAFKKFIDSLGIKPERGIDFNLRTSELGKAWDKYQSDNDYSKYDATKYTEYVYKLDPSKKSQDLYKGNIVTALGNIEKLDEVDLSSKEGKFVKTGESISTSDLLSDRYRIIDRRPSELGSTVLILDVEKGKAKRYEMPRGINQSAEDARDAAIQGKLIAQRKLQDPTLSKDDRIKWESAYDKFNQQQIMFEGQLDVINTTKDQSISPYYIP